MGVEQLPVLFGERDSDDQNRFCVLKIKDAESPHVRPHNSGERTWVPRSQKRNAKSRREKIDDGPTIRGRDLAAPAGCPMFVPEVRANVGVLDLDLDFAGCPMFVPEVRANVGVFEFLGDRRSSLKPAASIRHPPARYANRNRRSHRPPEWQHHIRDQSQHREQAPEDLSLHRLILPVRLGALNDCDWWVFLPAALRTIIAHRVNHLA